MNKKAVVKSFFMIFCILALFILSLAFLVLAYEYTTDNLGVTYDLFDDSASWERGEVFDLHEPNINQMSCCINISSHLPNQSHLYNGSRDLLMTVGASNDLGTCFNYTAPSSIFQEGVYYSDFGHGGDVYIGIYSNGDHGYPIVGNHITYLRASYANAVNATTSEAYHLISCTTRNGSADAIPPYFTTIPPTAIINYSKELGVLFVAGDNVAVSNFSVNSSLFEINSTGWLKNATDKIASGTYNINVSVNDTSYNTNSTVYTVTVTKALPNLTYYINNQQANISIYEPQQHNVSAYTDGGTFFVYLGDTDVTANAGDNVSFSPANYLYKFNVTGNQNYTDIAGEYMEITILKNRYYQLIYADSIEEGAFNVGNVNITQLSSNLWLINSTSSVSNRDKARAEVIEALYKPVTAGNATTAKIIQNITGITNIYSTDGRDQNKRFHYSYQSALNDPDISVTFYLRCNFTDTTNNYNVSSWSRQIHINLYGYSDLELPNGTLINRATGPGSQINDTFGENTSNLDTDNPPGYMLLIYNSQDFPTGQQEALVTSSDSITCGSSSSTFVAGTVTYWYDFFVDGGIPITTQSATSVSLTSPPNNYNSLSFNVNFSCSILQTGTNTPLLGNVSLWENSTGSWLRNKTNSITGLSNSTNFTVTFPEDETLINWTCEYCNAEDGCLFASENRTLNFSVDLIKPAVNITFPLNNTNFLTNNLDVNYTATDNVLIDSCWYSNDTYAVNTSLASCSNLTSIVWSEGIHKVRIYANDSASNVNYSSVYFTIDTINPNISIRFPTNNSNHSNSNLDINFSVADINLDYCWYSNDSYLINTTLSSCENITNIIWSEGQHNVTVWANDSVGNLNLSRISFRIDTIAPSVYILFPTNVSYLDKYNYSFELNVSVVETGIEATRWYSINSETNTTFTGNTTLSNLVVGSNKLFFYTNDSAGNLNQTNVSFYLSFMPKINHTEVSNSLYLDDFDLMRNAGDNWDASSFDEISHTLLAEYNQEIYVMNLTVNTTSSSSNYASLQSDSINQDWTPYMNGNFSVDFRIPQYSENLTIKISYGDTVSGAVQGNYTQCYYKPTWYNDSNWHTFTFYLNNSYNPTAYSCGKVGKMHWNNIQKIRFNIEYYTSFDVNNETFSILFDDMKVTRNNETPYLYKSDYLTEGLVAWWKFDKNWSTQEDSSGNGNNGSVIGATFTQNGQQGGAYHFDGINDYVSNNLLTPISNGTPITVSMWFENSYKASQNLFLLKNNSDVLVEFRRGAGNPSQIFWCPINISSGLKTCVGGYTFPVRDNQTYFLTAEYSGNNQFKIYIDGNQVGASNATFTNVLLVENTTLITLGGDNVYFNGTIDEFRIYNRTLSSSEIYNLYSVTKPTLQEYVNATFEVNITDEDTPQANLFYSWFLEGVLKIFGFAQNWFSSILTQESNNLTVIINDSDNNVISQTWNVSTTFINPTIAFVDPTPSNYTNQSTTSIYINFTGTEVNFDSGWIDFDGTNYTATCTGLTPYYCYYNFSSLDDKTYNFTAYVNDSVGNINSTGFRKDILIDTVQPIVNITYPINRTYSSNIYLDTNFTRTDLHLASCWYSNDTYSVNISLASCSNLTSIVWSEGQHNVTVWANDSVGNLNYSHISFTVDVTNPSANLTYPLNNSINNSIIQNFTVNISDNLGIQNATLSIFNSTGLFNQTSISFAPGLQTTYLGIIIYVVVDGVYQWVYSIFDWAGNTFTTQNNTLTIDTIISLVSIIYPNNNTYANDTNLDINYSTSDQFAGIDSCWYSNDTYAVNTSLASCSNLTSIVWSEGIHKVRIYANDSASNVNYSSVYFTIDTINPNISIRFPTNNSNHSNSNLDINFSVADINLDYCWYSNDSYLINTTLSSCENITTIVWSEGQHNVTVWANDSVGNLNLSRVSFTIDSTPPVSTATAILSNGSSYTFGDISTTSINVTISSFDSLIGVNNLIYPKYCTDTSDTCIPNLYAGTGVQITADGTSYIRFYANDTLNNKEVTQSKTIIIDTTADINITFPTNNSSTATNLEINYTLINYGLSETCWYTNDSGVTNYSITCGENITGRTWDEGINTISIYVNSSGLINYDSVSFTLDTTAPSITITAPVNNANYVNNSGIELNYSVNDVHSSIENCWYYVYNSSGSIAKPLTILPSCSNTTFSVSRGNTSYTVYVFTQDTLDHVNSSSTTFSINVVPPTISLIDANDTHKNYADNHTFNFTVFTNSLSIDTCELWGDFNGTWGLNQSKTDVSLTTQNAFTQLILAEGNYNWNVKCNDSINFNNWSSYNRTYHVDLTNPDLTFLYVTPFDATQNLNFNVSVNDSNPYTTLECFYTIFNSAGDVNGFNRNVSFTCNSDTSATATDIGTFNLSTWVFDKAGNFNQTSKVFTLTFGGSTGSGASGGEQKSSTVCLTSTGNMTRRENLQRCILYARIREACSGKVGCVLNKADDLIKKLGEQLVKINLVELMVWVDKYNNNELEVIKILDTDIKKYNLFTGIVQVETLRFSPIPVRLDPFYYFIISKKQLEYYPIKFNRLIQNISTLKGSYPGFSGKVISNSTSAVYLNISDYDFIANTFTGIFEYTSTEKETTFQEVQFRVFNLLNPWTGIILLGIIFTIIMLIIIRKRITKVFSKIKLKFLKLFKHKRK